MIGKVIGGILGAFVAGPHGFFLGATIGHFACDAGKKKRKVEPFDMRNDAFIKYAASAAAKIAKAKGFVVRDDIDELENIFKQLNFDTQMRRLAISHFRRAKDDSVGVEEIATAFVRSFSSANARQAFFGILLRVAIADGHLDSREAAHLRSVARIVGIDSRIVDQIEHETNRAQHGGNSGYSSGRAESSGSRRSVSRLADDYAVLGLPESASLTEVKSVYRKKCKELHPDILRSKGLGDHALKVIEDELRRVNDSYDRIMRAKS